MQYTTPQLHANFVLIGKVKPGQSPTAARRRLFLQAWQHGVKYSKHYLFVFSPSANNMVINLTYSLCFICTLSSVGNQDRIFDETGQGKHTFHRFWHTGCFNFPASLIFLRFTLVGWAPFHHSQKVMDLQLRYGCAHECENDLSWKSSAGNNAFQDVSRVNPCLTKGRVPILSSVFHTPTRNTNKF